MDCLYPTVVFVPAQIALDTGFWTIINHVFVWGSLGLYFSIMFALHNHTLFKIFPNQFHFVGQFPALSHTHAHLFSVPSKVMSYR